MKRRFSIETTSFTLHILAMLCMLCDHLWGTVVPGNNWLTCIGRIAFPIFAFMIVEGYFHTKNLKKYVLRLFLFALLSEIPFNLAIHSSVFYPLGQNVLWSFLLSVGLIHWNEKVKEKKLWLRILIGAVTVLLGALGGLITFMDYHHAGVLTVLLFYFLRGKNWWNYALQLIGMWWINFELLGGIGYEFTLFGHTFFFAQQGLALLALIPIWLYRGRQGYYSKPLKYLYYGFYPAHLLILGLLKLL